MRTNKDYKKVKYQAALDLEHALFAICKKHGIPECALWKEFSINRRALIGEGSYTEYFLSNII